MANEININIQASIQTALGFKDQFNQSMRADQNATGAASGIQLIGTSASNIDFNTLTTAGYCCLQNLDQTNYVQWGRDASGTIQVIGRLKPNEIAVFRLEPGTNLRMQAHTAPCQVAYTIWND